MSTRALRALIAGIVGFVIVAGCTGETFDPSGPCTTDGRAAGAYPELEALVPRLFEGRAPDRIDSGRNCSPEALATLKDHGVNELRFAGATWDLGSGGGVTIAVFESATLEADWVAEFYEVGARNARKTESVDFDHLRDARRPAGRAGRCPQRRVIPDRVHLAGR